MYVNVFYLKISLPTPLSLLIKTGANLYSPIPTPHFPPYTTRGQLWPLCFVVFPPFVFFTRCGNEMWKKLQYSIPSLVHKKFPHEPTNALMIKHRGTFRDLRAPWTEAATGSYKSGSLGDERRRCPPTWIACSKLMSHHRYLGLLCITNVHKEIFWNAICLHLFHRSHLSGSMKTRGGEKKIKSNSQS